MSPRNTFRHGGFVLEKLQCQEDIAAFDCGDYDLNEYFRVDSRNYRAELMTQTYCFYRENSSQKDAVALIDFCNDSLARNFIPGGCRRRINYRKRGYKSFPALKITRLGVDNSMHGMHIGSRLLDTVKLFFITDNRTGCRFLTVDSYRRAKGFYEANGFVAAELPGEESDVNSETIPMFYDLRRVERPE